MPSAYTRTYTVTKTRLETIEDQFAHFLQFGGIKESLAEGVLKGVRNKWLTGVGLYVCNAAGRRILEVELKVDWTLYGELSITEPRILTDLPGWETTLAPEVKVAGRRFAQAAKALQAAPRVWVQFSSDIVVDPQEHDRLAREIGFSTGSKVEEWSGEVENRDDKLLDLPELEIYMRSADG